MIDFAIALLSSVLLLLTAFLFVRFLFRVIRGQNPSRLEISLNMPVQRWWIALGMACMWLIGLQTVSRQGEMASWKTTDYLRVAAFGVFSIAMFPLWKRLAKPMSRSTSSSKGIEDKND